MFTKLTGLNYKIVYKKGVENRGVDALSRNPYVEKLDDHSACYGLSVCQPKWLQQVLQSYEQDEYAQDLITKMTLDSFAVPHFTLQHGLLRYKNMIWIGSDSALHSELMSAFQASAVGGHSGVMVTYRRMKQCIAWKGMELVVKSFINACLVY
jgi:hypothetical protein